MTQVNNPFVAQTEEPVMPPRTSKLAVWSLICSILICCPALTALGVILGLAALPAIGRNPALRGRGMAIAGILIGVITTAGTGYASYKLYSVMRTTMTAMNDGPTAIMEAGKARDFNAVRAGFYGAGATATDQEIADFFDTLDQRYGPFVSSQWNQPAMTAQPGQSEFPIPYFLTFENVADVDAELDFVVADQTTGAFVNKPRSITIFDAERGDLTFP